MDKVTQLSRRLFHGLLIACLLGLSIYFISQIFQFSEEEVEVTIEEEYNPVFKYGFNVDEFVVMEDFIPENKFFSDLLTGQGVPYQKIHELVQNVSDDFDMRQIRAGKKCAFITNDLCSAPTHFIYEPSKRYYYCFDIDQGKLEKIDRPVTTEIVTASGIINGSLWQSMEATGHSWSLIDRMENALAWTLDFYSIQNGDEYKLIYEKLSIDGKPIGVGQLIGAYYKNYSNEYYAIYYENNEYEGFYDIEGRPTKRAFLKSPVKFSRVSSGYSGKRFHPVLKRFKAHLGTDYAAPTGTPILAVANGVVSKRGYTRGNGNYIKIKHDRTYQTQYLHMSRFADGVRPGVHVKQGQVIGYVGQTGLATGPHVCFRFWKNGRQVNHRRLNFPPVDPLPKEELHLYECERDYIVEILNNIETEKTQQQLVENQ